MPKLPTVQEIAAFLNKEEEVEVKPATALNKAPIKIGEQPPVIKTVAAKIEEPLEFVKITISSTNPIYIDALTKAIILMDKK